VTLGVTCSDRRQCRFNVLSLP